MVTFVDTLQGLSVASCGRWVLLLPFCFFYIYICNFFLILVFLSFVTVFITSPRPSSVGIEHEDHERFSLRTAFCPSSCPLLVLRSFCNPMKWRLALCKNHRTVHLWHMLHLSSTTWSLMRDSPSCNIVCCYNENPTNDPMGNPSMVRLPWESQKHAMGHVSCCFSLEPHGKMKSSAKSSDS